jgi:hypothetical protein
MCKKLFGRQVSKLLVVIWGVDIDDLRQRSRQASVDVALHSTGSGRHDKIACGAGSSVPKI